MPYFAEIDIPALVGVLTGFGLVVVLPIVSMLLTHQRRMAELFRGAQDVRSSESSARVDRLERELSLLRQQVAENILAFDDHRQRSVSPPPVPERLSQEQ